MNRPALSIVVPAYNEEKYLGTCLTAILKEVARTTEAIEIIVIDNASTDGTAAVAAQYPGVRVVPEPKKGLTRARQRGLLSATADLIAYVDADTIMPEDWIKKSLGAFDNNPRIVCLSGPYQYYDAPLLVRVATWIYWRALAIPMYLAIGYMAVGGNFVIRKEAMLSVGGFDESIAFYGEDTDLARRLHKVGTVRFSPSFYIPTSARRLAAEGPLTTAYRYVLNFLSEVIFHKSVTNSYEDIR